MRWVPTSLSWQWANSVEWVRYNVPFGIGNWAADHVELLTYSSQAPKKAGPQLKSLPKWGYSLHGRSHFRPLGPPRLPDHCAPCMAACAITPTFSDPLPGEVVVHRPGSSVDGGAPKTCYDEIVLTRRTWSIVAYVAWFDHSRTEASGHHPGCDEPPNAAATRYWRWTRNNPRSRLLATFTGGFTYVDGDNGSARTANEPARGWERDTPLGHTDGPGGIVVSERTRRWPAVALAGQSLVRIVLNSQLNPHVEHLILTPIVGSYAVKSPLASWCTPASAFTLEGNLIYVAADDPDSGQHRGDPSTRRSTAGRWSPHINPKRH